MQTRKGIVLVYVAVILIVLVAILGLSLDWGKAALNVHQLHNGADAAALAGAQVVKFNYRDPYDPNGARQRAIVLAKANIADMVEIAIDRNEDNDPGGELVLGRWVRQERKFYPTLDAPNAVKAVGLRAGQRVTNPPIDLYFGGIFGHSKANAGRYAIAQSIGSTGAGIICLASDPNGFDPAMQGIGFLQGSSVVDLTGPDGTAGDIQINSRSEANPKSAAVVEGTSAKIFAGEVNACGIVNPEPVNWDRYYGDPTLPFSVNEHMPPVPDPLAYLNNSPPDPGTMSAQTQPDVSGGLTATVSPGYYPNGLNPEGGTVNMEPGLYVVGGGPSAGGPQATGINFNGGRLIGHGVTVYIAEGAQVNIGAKAYVDLISPGDLYPNDNVGVDGLDGVVFWQDIDNHTDATIIGTSDSPLKGTLYFPDCLLHLGGGISQVGNQVLAGALRVEGNVKLGVAYDGRNTIKAYRSVLVE